jgi:hypothetical protein
MKLSDTQMQILAAAAVNPLRLAIPPAKLPTAAREAVRSSLLAKGLVEAVDAAADEHETWATEAGPVTYRLVAQEPTAGTTAAVEAGEAPGGLRTVRRKRHRPTRRPQSPWRAPCRSAGPVACATLPRPL